MRSQFKGYFYSLLVWPITGKHFKLNPSTVDKCKLKLCLIFLIVRLSSAIASKQLAWFSWNFNTHSLNTVDNAEKKNL